MKNILSILFLSFLFSCGLDTYNSRGVVKDNAEAETVGENAQAEAAAGKNREEADTEAAEKTTKNTCSLTVSGGFSRCDSRETAESCSLTASGGFSKC